MPSPPIVQLSLSIYIYIRTYRSLGRCALRALGRLGKVLRRQGLCPIVGGRQGLVCAPHLVLGLLVAPPGEAVACDIRQEHLGQTGIVLSMAERRTQMICWMDVGHIMHLLLETKQALAGRRSRGSNTA